MKCPTRNRWFVPAAALLLLVCFSAAASAQKALVQDLTVRPENDAWKVGFFVEKCFTEKMDEAVETGIETIFTFHLHLYQKRNWPWDRKVGSLRFHHTLRFDPIRNEYQVTLGETGESLSLPSLEEAKRRMACVEEAEIRLSAPVSSGAALELRVKAELDTIRLPFHLESLFFFVSLWDFETEWHVIPVSR